MVLECLSPRAQLTYSVGGTLKFELPSNEVSLLQVTAPACYIHCCPAWEYAGLLLCHVPCIKGYDMPLSSPSMNKHASSA
jgi:hypothetical protein